VNRDRSAETDARDTGEHFFGSLVNEQPVPTRASAQRAADLAAQIEFLDREVSRYRDLLATERIKHSTGLADLQLASDTRLDALQQEQRKQTQALHDSYRALLNNRQVEFDQALSEATNGRATELADELGRQRESLDRAQARREIVLGANHQQTVDEMHEAHTRAVQEIKRDLSHATSTIERLQSELATQAERADNAEQDLAGSVQQVADLERKIQLIATQARFRVDEAEKQATAATDRLNAERRRSSATLAELLERSASIAAEADKARSELAAKQVQVEHAAAKAVQRAQADYRQLATAADEQVARAIARETELEDAIAQLRARLHNNG